MSNVVHANDKNFDELVLKSEKPVLVDFWATWCNPCKMIAPILDELSKERSDIKIVKVDIEESSETAKKFNVRAIPTLYLFINGKVEASKMGASSKSSLAAWIDSSI